MSLRQSITPLTALLLMAGCSPDAAGPPPGPASQSALPDSDSQMPVVGPEVPILAFGDSLFAGYGLASGESYPARLEAALRASGVNARIVNASVSGDTTADGLQRLSFALDAQPAKPRLVLISLGGNDMLRGLAPEKTRKNLEAILDELRRRSIRPVLMGMLAPPNMGAEYRARFDPIYPSLARKYDAVLVPFFLQAVVGKPDLVQADHIHPTARGIEEVVAATMPVVLKGVPKEAAPPRR